MRLKVIIRLLLFLMTGNITVSSQISIAPATIYIHDDERIASMQIGNGPDSEKEISISFKFGYPSSDSLGNLIMVYNDTVAEERYGLGNKLRVFPRHFVLPPGSQQTVRLQILPDKGKPDGAYWSRMIISSSTAVKDIDEESFSAGSVSTGINYTFRQNIAVFYLKGKVTTGLIPGKVRTSLERGILKVVSELKPSGNCPFNGSVSVRLSDKGGNEVAFNQQTVVVYFDVLKCIEMALPEGDLRPGSYNLEFIYKTERSDIAPSDLVKSDPVHHKVPLVIE
jgi:hypothetical protein